MVSDEQPTLPGLPGPPDYERPAGPKETYQRGLTRRQRNAIMAGVHPLTRRPLATNGETCGSCRNMLVREHTGRRYFKCIKVGITHGPGTDLRRGWPACDWWEARA